MSLLTKLLEVLEAHLLPSDATAIAVSYIAEILSSATRYDPEISKVWLHCHQTAI